MPSNLPPPPPPPPGQGPTDTPKLNYIAKSILKKKGLNSDPLPNIDEMILLFLHEHDVDVRPPSGTKAGDAVSGAFFGALGPAASFAGAHLRQQEKIAAMQEWTSWKQWALGHADWPAFRDKLKRDYEDNQKAVKEAMSSSWFHAEYEEQKAIQRKASAKSSKRANRVAWIIAILVLLGSACILIIGEQFERRYSPSPGYSRPDY